MEKFQLIRNRFLLKPIILVAALFLLDKVFLIPEFRQHTRLFSRIEGRMYRSREDLFLQLQQEYAVRSIKNDRLGLIFGNSMTGSFSNDYIAKKIPGSYTYNFSVPQGGIAFHYYWLERILESGIRPDFIVMAAGPISFGPNIMDFAIAHSFDLPFVLRNTDFVRNVPADLAHYRNGGFSFDEFETFLLKNLFAVYRYPPDFDAFRKNNEQIIIPDMERGIRMYTGREVRLQMLEGIDLANRINRGGIPNPVLQPVFLPRQMEANAYVIAGQHLGSQYRMSPTQTAFFQKILEILSQHKIPAVFFWPPVHPTFRRILEERKIIPAVKDPILAMLDESLRKNPDANFKLVDYVQDYEIGCKHFSDAIHLAGGCFPALTDHLVRQINETRKNQIVRPGAQRIQPTADFLLSTLVTDHIHKGAY